MNSIQKHIQAYYRSLYASAEPRPLSALPILSGSDLARFLGYPDQVIREIPESFWSRFHPCGYPLYLIRPEPNDRVLNLGSGVGIDGLSLLLTHEFPLHVVNLDLVEEALTEGAKCTTSIIGAARGKPHDSTVQWVCADAERLPFSDDTFRWVILNGVLNLFSYKEGLLRDVLRVLTPGGGLVGADLCVLEPVPAYFADEPDAWAWCMSGACTADSLTDLFQRSGFSSILLEPAETLEMFYGITFSCRKRGSG